MWMDSTWNNFGTKIQSNSTKWLNERGSQHDKHNHCFFLWQRSYPYLGGSSISKLKETGQSYKGNTISGFESFTLNPDHIQVPQEQKHKKTNHWSITAKRRNTKNRIRIRRFYYNGFVLLSLSFSFYYFL